MSTFNGTEERADVSFDFLEHVGHVAVVQLVIVELGSYDLQAHRVLLLVRQAQPGFQSVVVQIEELADHRIEQLNDLPAYVECLRQMILQKLVDRLQRWIVGKFELDLLSIVDDRDGNHDSLRTRNASCRSGARVTERNNGCDSTGAFPRE